MMDLVPPPPPRRSDEAALASAVRHDANNMLAALSGTIDILLRTAVTDRDEARARRLREATDRLEALFKAYLALAAPAAQPAGGTDGAHVLTLMRPLLPLAAGEARKAEIDAAPGLPRLAITPAALQAEMLALVRAAAPLLAAGANFMVRLDHAVGGAELGVWSDSSELVVPPVTLAAASG